VTVTPEIDAPSAALVTAPLISPLDLKVRLELPQLKSRMKLNNLIISILSHRKVLSIEGGLNIPSSQRTFLYFFILR
jgi:hypothetical protein